MSVVVADLSAYNHGLSLAGKVTHRITRPPARPRQPARNPEETGMTAAQYHDTHEIVIAATLWLMHRHQQTS